MENALAAPWVERFQSGWAETEETQPLAFSSPCELYRSLRRKFALAHWKKEEFALGITPWMRDYAPLAFLDSWRSKHPLPPRILSCGMPLLSEGAFPSLAEACQLILLWALYAKERGDEEFQRAAEMGAGWALPLIHAKIEALGSLESEYRCDETRHSSALLLKSCGYAEESAQLCIPSLQNDPFFALLLHADLQIDPKGLCLSEPVMGYRLQQWDQGALALALAGNRTAAGAARMRGLKIHAFGLQGSDLSDLSSFGVRCLLSENGWFRSAASEETWFCLSGEAKETGVRLRMQQAGRNPKERIAWSFYLSADSCMANGKLLKQKSLVKFSELVERVDFTAEGSKISFVLDRPLTVEINPLGGTESFWGASFLVSLWLPMMDSTVSCQIVDQTG